MEQQATKGIIAGVLVVITHIINSMNVLFFILLLFLIVDSVTGIGAAYIEGDINKNKCVKGVIKKIGYISLVMVGALFDLTIIYTTKEMGFELPVKGIFGFLIIGWLIVSEAISATENLSRMGVKIPIFLIKGFKIFQKTIDAAGDKNVPEGENEAK